MIIKAFSSFGTVYLNKERITIRIRLLQWKEYFHTKPDVVTGPKYTQMVVILSLVIVLKT